MWLPKVLRGGVRLFCNFFRADDDDDANGVLIAVVLCFLRGSVLGVTPPAPLLPLSPLL